MFLQEITELKRKLNEQKNINQQLHEQLIAKS
jgi:hypothetical protein